jgi:hypothetical protein
MRLSAYFGGGMGGLMLVPEEKNIVMKSFVIFPTLSILLMILTFLNVNGQTGKYKIIGLTTLVTFILGGLLVLYSVELFRPLFYLNFISVIISIPCLTYLINKLFPEKASRVRLLGLGIILAVLAIALFLITLLAAFIQNPMDPIGKDIGLDESQLIIEHGLRRNL